MDSTREDTRESNGPPAKRRRLSNTEQHADQTPPQQPQPQQLQQQQIPQTPHQTIPQANGATTSVDEDQLAKETKAGITVYVNPDASGFTGVLKQRYTDFLVNEVLPDGRVLHLEDLAAPKRVREEVEGKKVVVKGEEKEAQKEGEKEEKEGKEEEKKEKQEEEKIIDKAKTKAEETTSATNGKSFELSSEDRASLESIFGADTTNLLTPLYTAILGNPTRKPKDFKPVTSPVIANKDTRTLAHQTVRKIFSSRLETKTQDDETIFITAAAPAGRGRGGGGGAGNAPRVKNKLGWDELGGEYLHFTLYKENKDTMESVYFLASQLKVGIKDFQFGGTKDRRGVTVQRVSAYRVHAEQMAAVGKRMYGSKVGDYEYCPQGLELGELGGNEFLITLRDCHFPGEDGLSLKEREELASKVITESMESFRKGGFINYYGLQRFGSFAASTDEIGTKLLKGDLKGAIDDILSYSPAALAAAQAANDKTGPTDNDTNSTSTTTPLISSDDRSRALAIHTWQTTQNSNAALALLPRKFSAESAIIRHLGYRDRRSKNPLSSLHDYQGALQCIPRNLRLMYVHAYQSLVWNVVAGQRWERFGGKLVEGDLVLVEDIERKTKTPAPDQPLVDEAGEPIIIPTGENSSLSTAGSSYQRARALTAAEASSGTFDVFDVVLPLPGYDVEYPPNAIGDVYKEFMKSERGGGLDPLDMRRNWKDLSLSGGYRKMLGRCPSEALRAEVRVYRGEEQLVETDRERLEKKGRKEGAESGANGAQAVEGATFGRDAQVEGEEKIAVVLLMRLKPSQYATMALRELMKQGGVQTYKPDYGGGR